jgi:YHS domain-containing protein
MLLEEEQKGRCFVCYKELDNKGLFLEIDGKNAYFCSNNCKIEWIMKKDNV